jgi:acyl transferase domain-containing protein
MSVTTGAGREPVAIVGIGCRVPGARGPEAFWELVRSGTDAIRETPDERAGLRGGDVARYSGYLDDVDAFDAAFFGISPREAERMDPQQRLLLETAWEALEDAGLPADRLAGSATGVFVGLWINDYESLLFADPARVDFYMTTGSGRYSASGRLSYAFGLQGPSLTVDTACSSSLVAIHLACQALRAGECELALAGGANTIFAPQVSRAYSQASMLAKDGRCKFGDARADGYVRSEGAGLVALKPLARALADGDRIHAVILGSAVNNDGNTSGFLSTPGQSGQEDLLRKAYRAAGVVPGRVQYVEAHGTGTSAGDPVELQALGAVLAEGREAGQPCLVGSVKTNIGHTEGAAGVAGLVKVALALQHREVPASLHHHEPTPSVAWAELPLVVPRALSAWPEGHGIAGVSGFGIAGTNAHVVVQEAPRVAERPAVAVEPRLLPLSARSPEALRELARAYVLRLTANPADFSDVVYTASLRRAHLDHRLAVVASDAVEAAARLGEAVASPEAAAAAAGAPRVVFVFPGQGSQWLGMGRELAAREPAFRASLEASDAAVQRESGFSVLAEIAATSESSRLDEIDVVQPVLFSIQVALAALWRSWGLEPAAVVGHSMGEVAAAHVAGVLSLDDAARVICRRSRLLRRTRGRGAMALVELSMGEAQEALHGYEDRLSVAVSNSSRSTVLSGEPAALDAVLASLAERDVFCRRVKVDVASHSPQMDELRDDLLAALAELSPGPGRVPLYSTVTGAIGAGASMDAAYWARNLREPVLFSSAIARLAEDGHSAFLEVSAHPILLPAIQQELLHLGAPGVALGSLRRDEPERRTLLESLGGLYAAGCDVAWSTLQPAGGRCVSLPSYPWQHERFWHAAAVDRGASRRSGSQRLLGPHVVSSIEPGTHYWQTELVAADLGSGSAAAALVEMAVGAAADALEGPAVSLSEVAFESPLRFPGEGPLKVQVVLTRAAPGSGRFQVSSLPSGATTWTRHVTGDVHAEAGAASVFEANDFDTFVACQAEGAEGPVEAEALGSLRLVAGGVEIVGLKLRPATPPTVEAETFALEWVARSSAGVDKSGSRWLLLTDRGGLGAELTELLRAHGDSCMTRPAELANASEGLAQALRESGAQGAGVVYLGLLDAGEAPADAAASEACLRVLRLTQALGPDSRLWVVTRGAQPAGPAFPVNVAASAVWGLGRVGALESPESWGGLVDLDPSPGEGDARSLFSTLTRPDADDQVAFRGGERYVPRLTAATFPTDGLWLAGDASYLVTGGLGQLGLQVAEGLVKRGARHLVLLGRGGLARATASAVAALGRLEAAGATLHVCAADVADVADMARVFTGFGKDYPELRGVVHAAGTLSVAPLAELGSEALAAVLRPKVAGSWLLHEHTRGKRLDFFVLFSSAAAVWGSMGLGHYAAANHFLDGLAHHRRALGLPALSVNWGLWSEGGITSAESEQFFRSVGLVGMSTARGLDALAGLVSDGAVQATVAAVDWAVFKGVYEAFRPRPLLEQVGADPEATHAASAESFQVAEALLALEPGRRRRAYLETHLRERVARVLKLPPARVDAHKPFKALGLDSLMALELRNRLEADLGLRLQATMVWNHPTVTALTTHLASRLGIALDAPVEPTVPAVTNAADGDIVKILDEIEQLSDEEARRVLADGTRRA